MFLTMYGLELHVQQSGPPRTETVLLLLGMQEAIWESTAAGAFPGITSFART